MSGLQQLDSGAQPFLQLAFALQKLVASHVDTIETQTGVRWQGDALDHQGASHSLLLAATVGVSTLALRGS